MKGKVTVKVPKAEGLPEGCDSYAFVYMVKDTLGIPKPKCMCKIDKVKNESNPQYDFDSGEKGVKDDYRCVKIVVKESKFGPNTKLGEVEIPCEEIVDQKVVSGAYPLECGGTLYVEVVYEEGSAGIFGEFETTSDSD